MDFAAFVIAVGFGILLTVINFYFFRAVIVSGIKQAFKDMEETKLLVKDNAEIIPIRTDKTLITKSGTVFERKTQQT